MKLDLLYERCGELQVEVQWHDLGRTRRGDYNDDARLIRVNRRLTQVQAISTLAHEVAHAVYRDRVTSRRIEQRADQVGASLIIAPEEYAQAELLVGPNPVSLASVLEVTPRLVLAWRRWWARNQHADQTTAPLEIR